MKIYQTRTADIDQRLLLDKRKTGIAFCSNFESELEIPPGFYDRQDRIRDVVEKEFFEKFGDGKDQSNLKPWQVATSNEQFFFSAELINSERVIIEISSEMLNDRLIGLLLLCLEKFASQYCVIGTVCLGKNIKGSNYVGRFVVNLEEIAVEESLAEIWSKQMQDFALEKNGIRQAN